MARWGWAAGWRVASEAAERRLRDATTRITELEALLEAQIARADRLTDRLLEMAGIRGVREAREVVEQREAHKEQLFLHQLAHDPTEELPFGHPDGMYTKMRDALLDPDVTEEREPT